jgi:hypothetical protein
MHTSPHQFLIHRLLSAQTKARIHGTPIKHCLEKENCVCNFSDCPCKPIGVLNLNNLGQKLVFKSIEMPESDRQYLESINLNSEEIAEFFGYKKKPKYSTLQEEMIKGRF